MAPISRLRVATPLYPPLRKFLSNRALGSAVQYNYDFDDSDFDDDEHYGLCKANAMADTQGCSPPRGVQWAMIGEPASKRHFFAEKLSKLLDVPHISMATLLSQELCPRSSLYRQIGKALDAGKIVPEEITFRLLSKRLEDGYLRGETGFILNGIPRTRTQAEILDHTVRVDLVINFKCSEQNLGDKNLKGQRYNPSPECRRVESNLCGSSWRGNVHHLTEECKLLEEYYNVRKKLVNFEVAGGPGETWQGLLAALHLQHIAANTPSHKLTA